MEPRLQLERSPPQAGLERGTARLVGQRLAYRATGSLIIEIMIVFLRKAIRKYGKHTALAETTSWCIIFYRD